MIVIVILISLGILSMLYLFKKHPKIVSSIIYIIIMNSIIALCFGVFEPELSSDMGRFIAFQALFSSLSFLFMLINIKLVEIIIPMCEKIQGIKREER